MSRVVTEVSTFTNHPDCTDCCSDCDCPCCETGYWTEFTFTISDIVPFFFGTECSGYDGTWTLKYRGLRPHLSGQACVWSTDEVVDGVICEGDVALHPFEDTPEKWLLYCYEGSWTLVNAGTSVAWFSGPSLNPIADFCVDGGDLLYVFADTSACCKWNSYSVYPTESNYLTISTSGTFVTC